MNEHNLTLFEDDSGTDSSGTEPLASKLRPKNWDNFQQIAQIGEALSKQLKSGEGLPPSLILWGPPGCGKTTLAKLIGETFKATFVELSAVLVGVKEVREVIAQAKLRKNPTILFIDEVHRFNKAQQDAFLPHIENGTIVFIGATTENPSFALNNALLSRAKVIQLSCLLPESLENILLTAQKKLSYSISKEAKELLVSYSLGDARRMLNMLDTVLSHLGSKSEVTVDIVKQLLSKEGSFHYDRDGDEHYNLISAFIKSMRGSNPDAALYWGFRILESGEDPSFLLRRMVIFAAEDIGNADPRALQLAVSTSDAFDRIGMPEGRIPIAQCITYLASVPKSNRSYEAMHKALKAVSDYPRAEVPLHLRNAPTTLMKDFGYGKEYRYPHGEEEAFAKGVQYLPDELENEVFYEPSERGLEVKIKEHLSKLNK